MKGKVGAGKGAKLGECCEAMDLAVWRGVDARIGLTMETLLNFRTGKSRPAIAIRFRKPKKTDQHYADVTATFALVNFCPFCGVELPR